MILSIHRICLRCHTETHPPPTGLVEKRVVDLQLKGLIVSNAIDIVEQFRYSHSLTTACSMRLFHYHSVLFFLYHSRGGGVHLGRRDLHPDRGVLHPREGVCIQEGGVGVCIQGDEVLHPGG